MSNQITAISVHGDGTARPVGLKRQLFDVALAGCDLFVGPNGAGKTTQGVLAPTAAIEGLATVPTDSRRPFIGALPDHTLVTLTVQTPAGVETLTRDLSASRGLAVTEANQRARDLVGIPPTAWDLRDFASGTDGDRGKILDAVARAGGALERWDADRAQHHVQTLMLEKVPENTDPELWTAPLEECLEALETAPDGATWLKAAEGWATDAQTRTNAKQKDAGAHMGELVKNKPPEPDSNREADEAERRDLLRRQAAWEATDEEIKKAKQALERHEAEGKRLREALEATVAEGKRLKEDLPEPDLSIPADVVKRLKDAEAAMEAPIPTYDGPDAEALRQAVTDAEAGYEVAKAETARRQAISDTSDENVSDFAKALAEAERKSSATRAEVSALESVSAQGHATCRHCQGEDPLGIGAALEDARQAAQDARDAEDQAQRGLDQAEELAAEHSKALAEAATAERAALDALYTARHRLEASTEARAGHADRVRTERQRELDAAKAAYDRETARIDQLRQQHEKAKRMRNADLIAARNRWKAANEALKAWESLEAPEIPDPPSAERRALLAEQLAAVEARLSAHRIYEDHLHAAREAGQRYDAAKLHWGATRALVSALRQARDDVAAAAYSPIARAARKLFEDAPGLPRPYFDSPAEYGAEVPGRGCVPYAGLSESEARVTAAALVFALATVARCPCRLVLLDGLEVVQRDQRALLISALARAKQRGEVDNVVITMATAPGEDLGDIEAIEGLTLHRVERVDTARVETPPRLTVVPDVEPQAANSNPGPSVDAGSCPF